MDSSLFQKLEDEYVSEEEAAALCDVSWGYFNRLVEADKWELRSCQAPPCRHIQRKLYDKRKLLAVWALKRRAGL